MFFGCRICKRTDRQHYGFSHAGEDFFMCEACGAGYLAPGLSGNRLDAFYKSDYRRTYLYEVMGYSRALFFKSRGDLAAARARLQDIEADLPQNGSVWEIGSGLGAFMAVLGRARPDLTLVATEPDEGARCSFNPPSHICFEDFETASAKRYDHIVAFHVLEHVVDPVDFLQTCRAALKPGGALTIEVPDYGADLADRGFVHPAHLSYFTVASLALLASNCGFDVRLCKKIAGDARGASILLSARPGDGKTCALAQSEGWSALDMECVKRIEVSARARWRRRLKDLGVGLFGPRFVADALRVARLTRQWVRF